MNTYTTYRCNVNLCRREFVLLTEDLDSAIKDGIYIVCPYCSSRNVSRIKETDSLKECMDHSTYKRHFGALKQIKLVK